MFGRRNLKQASCQATTLSANGTQTELCNHDNKATQWPPSHRNEYDNNEVVRRIEDPVQFHKFFWRAQKIVSGVIESQIRINKSQTKPDDGTRFVLPTNFFPKRLASVHWFSGKVASLYDVEDSAHFKSAVLVWSEVRPNQIEHMLVSQYELFKIISDSKFLVICANRRGSLLVWDLREPEHLHESKEKAANCQLTMRRPSFSTGLNQNRTLNSDIVEVLYQGQSEQCEIDRIVVSHEDFVVDIWKIEDAKEDLAFSEDGQGMSPSSQIKLAKIRTLELRSILRKEPIKSPLIAFAVIGQSTESYLLGSLSDGIFAFCPGQRRLDHSGEHFEYINNAGSVPIRIVRTNKWLNDLFLVAFEDSSIGLYSLQSKNPTRILSPTESKLTYLLDVQWVSSNSFLALDKFEGIKYIKNEETVRYDNLLKEPASCFYPFIDEPNRLKVLFHRDLEPFITTKHHP